MRRAAASAAALLLVALAGGALPRPSRAASPPPDAYLGVTGRPLLMPINRTSNGRTWYFEVPKQPVGTVVMLHRCGRNAQDFWPPSEACPQCIGMPEGVSITKQALARGYAVIAINSADRSTKAGGRCWSWKDDAVAVRTAVEGFRENLKLQDRPLFLTGCSSGGSLALRLPGFMKIDGVMSVAIGLDAPNFPLNAQPPPAFPYPPTVMVNFPADPSTGAKVDEMLGTMKAKGVPGAVVQAPKLAITPDFFSQRTPMISPALSKKLHAVFKKRGVIDARNQLTDGWVAAKQLPPWDAALREELPRLLRETAKDQLALRDGSFLAQARAAYSEAEGKSFSIQEAGEREPDYLVEVSASDGLSSSSGGVDPYLSPVLMEQQIKEELGVAWAHHNNLGDYTTAALAWLERCGQPNFGEVASALRVSAPAALTPLRTAPKGQTVSAWRACSSGGKAPPVPGVTAASATPGSAEEQAPAAPAATTPVPPLQPAQPPSSALGRAAGSALAALTTALAAAVLLC